MISIDSSVGKRLVEKSKEWLEKADENAWSQALAQEGHLFKLAILLKESKKIEKLSSENLLKSYKEFQKQVAQTFHSIPTTIKEWNLFLDLLEAKKLKSTFADVRDILLHHDHGVISKQEIMFFEKGLRKFGDLESKPGDVTRKFLTICINDEELIKEIFFINYKYYLPIIQKAGDYAEEAKEGLTKYFKEKEFSGEEEKMVQDISKELEIPLSKQ
jgi:hypothetical protein